jgi:hypothetical protein
MVRFAIRKTFLSVMYSFWLVGLYKLPPPTLSEIDIYEEKTKPKFIKNNDTKSESIDPIFYDRPSYKKLMEEPNNHLEKEWKTRILYENTPRGNIIMYYDVYKEGFAYYCDQTGISYRILNIVAMKYTTTFRCQDFFVDNLLIPDNKSPMIGYIQDELEIEEENKRKVTDKLLRHYHNEKNDRTDMNSPFAKLQNYSTNPPNKQIGKGQNATELLTSKGALHPEKLDQSKTPEKEKDKISNKFMYMGKCSNFSMIQKIPHKEVVQKPPSLMNYKLFKERYLDFSDDLVINTDDNPLDKTSSNSLFSI